MGGTLNFFLMCLRAELDEIVLATTSWPRRKAFSVRCRQRSFSSHPSPTVKYVDVQDCTGECVLTITFQATILPVIVTNHTVTIAAELVSEYSMLQSYICD